MTRTTLLRALAVAALATLASATTALAHGGEHHEKKVAIQFQAVAGATPVSCSTADREPRHRPAPAHAFRTCASTSPTCAWCARTARPSRSSSAPNDAFNFTQGPQAG